MDFLTIFGSILGFTAIGLLVYFIYIHYKGEDPENKPYLIHFGSQYSKGYAILIMDDLEFGENRVKIKISPRDINYIRALKDKTPIKLKTLFLDKTFFIPAGISTHRNIYFGLPQRVSDLPSEFRKTSLGKAFENVIMDKNKLKTTEDLYKASLESTTEVAKSLSKGEIFIKAIEVGKEQLLDREFIQKPEQKDEKQK